MAFVIQKHTMRERESMALAMERSHAEEQLLTCYNFLVVKSEINKIKLAKKCMGNQIIQLKINIGRKD